jgi:hypothetical protein
MKKSSSRLRKTQTPGRGTAPARRTIKTRIVELEPASPRSSSSTAPKAR